MDDPSIPEVLLERFGQSYGHIKNIHAALRKMEGASITDETMERLSISVSKMEMETGSPSPYFTPSAQQMPDPLQEKLEDDPFANQEWNWGPPASRWPPYFFLMQAFLYYQTSMKWLNRYLPEDQEDGKSPEKSEEETSKENMRQEENDEKELNGKQEGNKSPDGSEEHMSQEDMREKENDENELNGQQEGPGSPEWSEEHMCGHEETSEWDSDEESEKESEEHLKQRRKRRAELRRLYEERQRKIYEAEEARMVYEWNVYHYPGTYSYKPLENHHDFDIIRTGHRNNPLQCHQWVVALVDVSDENRPSITELVVLANRMLKAMNLQKRRLSTSQNDNNQFHHLFPTTIVTFDKYNRARVLSGYYDGGLKVHFTEPLDFDERTRYVFQGSLFERDWVSDPYYAEMMRRLAAWTWPKAQMNTAQTFTLPIISEGIGNGDHEL
ncbi:retrotransposon-like protein 1 [Penicillium rubens]|nr:retrotransposon-like protein 1 [Penicillium rubens]